MKYQTVTDQKIVVTGGAGFIGSNLCESLLATNNDVVCLDNFSTGRLENIAHLFSNPGFTLIRGDIRNPDDCKQAVTGAHAILHQAALGSVPRSIKDPLTSHEVNCTGFLNILLAAKEAGIKRFVYASSSSVYGDNPFLPKIEDQIGNPLSPYAATKRTGELYASCFSSLNPELEIIGLRYFNVFGRRQSPEGSYAAAIPKFIKALLHHESPVLYGDGTQSRDFTYIENVVHANHMALVARDRSSFNQIYNIACGESVTLNDLVNLLIANLGEYDSKIVHVKPIYAAPRPGDVAHSLASIEKAEKLLGYRPFYNFKEGLKNCIEWYWKQEKNRFHSYFLSAS